ncbi:MAG: O-antigen ligase family protein [Candidatus Rokubacteria bacterium]|nr:O-antigen ligase family protein [Candidatus Rokubacteria bacterium]
MDYAFILAIALAVFLVVFIKTEFGLYLVIFSMLLSPEIGSGGGGLAEGRRIIIRSEDVLLLVVAFSWFAKTAVNKELGLTLKTPLNRPIMLYVVVNALATLVGYATGTVGGLAGFFYVLKYVEYFVVYYMVVNNLTDRPQAWRLVVAAFLTAVIVSLIGAAQIPSGQRVSAPFEGTEGEPNTLGGYLLFMMAVAGGIALETTRIGIRSVCLGLIALMGVPFAYTLSRASFLGAPFALAGLWLLTTRRRLMGGVLLLVIVASPVAVVLLPKPVVERVLYTFEPEAGQPTVRLGGVAFDPSTSARLISVQQAWEGWTKRPILGYGVTGFGFMDMQYARTLVETGIIGLAAFLWLAGSALRSGIASFRALRDPEERGLAAGFVAGLVGLLVHSIGANTFIIVRIMEPFWFFAAVVVALPGLTLKESTAPPARPIRQFRRVA